VSRIGGLSDLRQLAAAPPKAAADAAKAGDAARTGDAARAGDAGKAKASKHAKDLDYAAREFEQIFVRAMLKGTPMAAKGDVYGDLAVDAVAKSVTAGHGLGLGEMIRRAIETSEKPLKEPR